MATGPQFSENLDAALSTSDFALRSDIWTRMSKEQIIDVTSGNPSLDMSSVLQQYIDDNRGGVAIIPPGRWLAAGLMMSGASYDSTTVIWQGEFVLSPRPTAFANNFGGAWFGLVIKDCDAVNLFFRGHGNRDSQPDEEHCHILCLAGVTNLTAPLIVVREMRGDGCYVCQSVPTSSSATPKNISIGHFSARNSADDGRNALSIISVQGMTIDSFDSYKVGGTVGGVVQPGGLDIEPNYGYQVCEQITVKQARVESAGVQVFGCFGKDQGGSPENWNIRDLVVGALHAKNTNPSATSGYAGAQFTRVNGLTIVKAYLSTHMESDAHGVYIDYAKNIEADITIDESPRGAYYGGSGWIRFADIKTKVKKYSKNYGTLIVGAENSHFSGRIYGTVTPSISTAVRTRRGLRGITQSNVRYSIHAPHDGRNVAAYYNEPTDLAVFDNCRIQQCDLTGYSASGFTQIQGMSGMTVSADVVQS